jgi:transmembrane sensor
MRITPEDREPAHGLDDDAWARLGRYLAGECTAAEAAEVERWAAAQAARRALLDELRDAWTAAGAPPRWNTDAAFARVTARIAGARAQARPLTPTPVIPFRRRPAPRRSLPWLRAAAAVVLLAGGVATANGLGSFRGDPAPLPQREVATTAGQRARVTLSDGTEVHLAPGSRLRYPAGFGADGRDVSLEGEGYFRVAKDPARPFRVHAAGSVTRVLGTRFGVAASPAGVRVVVEEGRVAFGQGGGVAAPGVELTAGWSARLGVDGALGAPERVDAARALAWTEGRLAFDGAPLTEVAAALERWYGVRIRLALPGADTLRLTADLEGARVQEALEIVGVALSLEVRSEGSTVVIRRPGAQ